MRVEHKMVEGPLKQKAEAPPVDDSVIVDGVRMVPHGAGGALIPAEPPKPEKPEGE